MNDTGWTRNIELAQKIGVERVCEFSMIAGMLVRKLNPPPRNPNEDDQGCPIGVWHQHHCDAQFDLILDTVHEFYSTRKPVLVGVP
jgi:hypothetical protein